MLAEILHALIDASSLHPNRRAELHDAADEAEGEFLGKPAAIQREAAAKPKTAPAEM